MINRFFLLAIGGLSPFAGPLAQDGFYTDVTMTHLPRELPETCMDAAVGDPDGDGDLDLVLAVEHQPNALLLNDGTGSFSDASSRLPSVVRDSEDVAFADMDGDGDLDLVFASEDDRANELYLNDGTGHFTEASDRLPVQGRSNALAILDLNGDGALDILLGNYGAEGVMINDGDGRFSDGTERHWPNTSGDTQDLELVDVDDDGDLDVLVANEGQNHLYLNQQGNLVDATRGRLPIREDESREFRAADVDGDGDMDLVLANVKLLYEWPRRDYLLLNDGSGVFTDVPQEAFPDGARDHFTIEVLDLDGDGDLDVLQPSSLFIHDFLDYRVLLNAGAGRFVVEPAENIVPDSVHRMGMGFDIEVADFNGDGADDLFLCNRSNSSNPRGGVVMRGRPSLLLRKERT